MLKTPQNKDCKIGRIHSRMTSFCSPCWRNKQKFRPRQRSFCSYAAYPCSEISPSANGLSGQEGRDNCPARFLIPHSKRPGTPAVGIM